MAVNLSPVGGVAGQFFDNNGNPLVGGKLFTYAAGTTTPQATYTSSSGVTPNSNPIILNGGGRVPSEIWLTDGLAYKFVLYTSTDQLVGSWDNISGINSNFVNFTSSQEIQTATAGQTVFTLTTMQYQPGTNSLTVYVDGVNQYGPGALFAYIETDSTTITFTNGLHVGAEVKFTSVQQATSSATDAAQVSYTPAGVGAVTTNVQTKLRETVSVKDFGAVGDGVTDDTAAIQAADTYAGANGKVLMFDGVDYLIKSQLTISAPWVGTPRKTRIIIGSPFVNGPINSMIVNKNFAFAFNSSTADSVFINGVDFLGNVASVLGTITLGNVKNGQITNCNLTSGTSGGYVTIIDIAACVKNFKVEKCEIRNLTQNIPNGGGCMWVRNLTSNGALAANDTENIQVVDCYFEHTTGDEAFAVYGVFGMSKNVRVTRCTFNGSVASVQRHNTLVTVFPLANNANAGVQDVVFSECRFESNNFINAVFRVGTSADVSNVCKDVRVENCYFKASTTLTSTTAIARNIPCVGGNVTFVNNIVDADGSSSKITYGVQQFDLVSDSTVTGNLSNAFYVCRLVNSCITKSVDTAATDCFTVSNCDLSASANGIVASFTARYKIKDNQISLTATSGLLYGVFFNSIASSAPFGEICNNTVILNNASAFAFRVAGTGVSDTRVNGNRVTGTGKTITGTQYKEIQGNYWYGTLDSLRSAGQLDGDHNNATPIGTFAAAITHTAGTNSYLLGFIKTANAGSAADWKSVYAGNTLT